MKIRRFRQRGISLVTALFVLVVLGALGVYLVTISAVPQSTTALSAQAIRAFFAAQSGMDWLTYRVLNDDACPAINFTLENFTISGSCTQTNVTEGTSYNVYNLQITAAPVGMVATNSDYVSRTLRSTVTQGP